MQTRYRRLARLTVGVAAVAAAAVALPVAVNAQPVGSPAAGPLTLTPSVGTSSTPLALAFSTLPQACQGNGDAGYRVETFIVPAIADPATIVYASSGAPASALQSDGSPVPAGAFMASLRATTGTQLRHGLPDLVDFSVDASFTSSVGFQATAAPAGDYKIGLACVLATETTRFWSLDVAVAPSAGAGPMNYNIGVPSVPGAPTITANGGDTQITGSLTASTSITVPNTTGYTVTATPTAGTGFPGSPTSVLDTDGGSYTIPGLSNSTTYSVSAVATNSVGNSPVSNVVTLVNVIEELEDVNAPVVNPATPAPAFADDPITVTWATPTLGPAPTSYNVVVSGGPTFNNVVGTSQLLGTLTAGSHTVSVTPNYANPLLLGEAGTTTVVVNVDALIFQEITVERPQGALVLTQRCGVYGELPAELGSPGFEAGFGLTAAAGGTTGTAPVTATNVPDPKWLEYPFVSSPVTYPTTCALDLQTAQLITSGPLAGAYYRASGRLNQVTVVDTRDIDAGWTVNGSVENFSSTGDTFDGDYLGWTPVLTSTTVGQVAHAGSPVVQGTGVLPSTPGTGLTSAHVLAETTAHPADGTATPAQGLGVAQLDARIKLLIPSSADSGNYSALLSLTVA